MNNHPLWKNTQSTAKRFLENQQYPRKKGSKSTSTCSSEEMKTDFNAEGLKALTEYKNSIQQGAFNQYYFEKAKKCFQQAANRGDINAYLNLAILFRNCLNSPIDSVDALVCFIKVCCNIKQLGKSEVHIQEFTFSEGGFEENKEHVESFFESICCSFELETFSPEEIEAALEYLQKIQKMSTDTSSKEMLLTLEDFLKKELEKERKVASDYAETMKNLPKFKF